MLALSLIPLGIILAIAVFYIIVMCEIYAKMGHKKWEAIVPIWNSMVLYKDIWYEKWAMILFGPWIAEFAIRVISSIASAILLNGIFNGTINLTTVTAVSSIISILAYAIGLATAIISAVTMFKLYKRFGKSTGFAIAGIFFSFVCLPICAYDNSTFI